MESSHPRQLLRSLMPRGAADGSRDDPNQRPKPVLPRKRPTVAAACDNCRKAKAKCNAARPECHRCLTRELNCQYDTADGSETHSAARKRRFTELTRKTTLHEELIHILRTRDDSTVGAILQRLRAGHDVDALVALVRDGDLLLQCSLNPQTYFRYTFPFISSMPKHLYIASNPYVDSLLHQRTITDPPEPLPLGDALADRWRLYDIPYHAATIVEPRIDRVTASRWTAVTSSDELVRALLRTYFQHEFPYSPFFLIDSFLDDLVSGRERYCSSLLVNAVLAVACHGQPGVPGRSSFWKPHTVGYQFLAEAKRLWELERGSKTRITTIQAGVLICLSCSMDGIDKVGASYLAQTIAMGVDMGLFSDTFDSKSVKQRAVYATTAWSLFAWQSAMQLHFYLEPLLPEPPVIPLPKNLGEIYVMYPYAGAPSRIHHSAVFHAIISFRTIMNEVGNRSFGREKGKGPMSLDEALIFRAKLLGWMQALPAALRPNQIVLPAPLKLHMHLYNFLINLFEPFVSTGDAQGPGASAATGSTPSPRDIVTSSRAYMESLIRLYYLRHSFEHWDSTVGTYLHFIGFSYLKSPSVDGRDADLSTVVLCAKGLRDQSRYCYMTEAIFIVLRDSMEPSSAHLLRDFAHINDEEERKELVARQVQSLFPVNVVSIADDPEKHRLSRLVEAYADFGLDSGTESTSESAATP